MSGVTRGQAFDRVWDGVVEQDFIEGVNGRSHDEGLASTTMVLMSRNRITIGLS